MNDVLTVSFVNPHATLPIDVEVRLGNEIPVAAGVDVLSHAELNAHNTFEEPEVVRPRKSDIDPRNGYVCPPASVNLLTIPIPAYGEGAG
jgi:alpha-L-arabinofuranosidase